MKIIIKALCFILFFATLSARSDDSPQWSSRTFGQGLEEMTVEILPASNSQAPAPLLIVLHGCAQTPRELIRHGNLEGHARARGIALALPLVPNGGAYLGCWDYYGEDHSREAGHPKALLEMIEGLLADESLNLDPKRVWLSGLSSGAGMGMLLACLAPDKVAGVGLALAPALGSLASELASVKTDVDRVSLCHKLAGERADKLTELKVSLVFATNDLVVSPEYGGLNQEFYRQLLAGRDQGPLPLLKTESSKDLPGDRPRGEERLFGRGERPQLSVFAHDSLGHRWPGGQGGRAVKYIARSSLDYPEYLMEFLLDE